MPRQEQSMVTVRKEFVTRATQEGANIAALCRQYGIACKTGYKWLDRAAEAEVRLNQPDAVVTR